MVQLVPYQEDGRQAAVTGAKQQAVSAGFGHNIGEGLQRAAAGLGRFAEGQERFNLKTDEAAARELDNQLAPREREFRARLAGALGRNSEDEAAKVREEWATTRQQFSGRVTNERQRSMLDGVLNAREERLLSFADGHVQQQMTVYHDQQEQSHIETLSADVQMFGVDDPDRQVAMQAVLGAASARYDRLGASPEVREAGVREITTGIHKTTVAALVEAGVPEDAEAWLTAHREEIDPDVFTTLSEGVRTEVTAKETFEIVSAMPDRSPATPTTVRTAGGEAMSLVRPVASTTITGTFGEDRGSHKHAGVDLATAVRTPVAAARDGTLRWRNDPDGYGRYAVIDHGNGVETLYAHMSAANIPDGTQVVAGQTIGMSGGARGAPGSGRSSGPHLHFEVRQAGRAVDPNALLNGGGGAARAEGDINIENGPASLEAALAEAREVAAERRPGDWRYARAMEQALTQRYGRSQQIEADKERNAADLIAPYLTNGAQAVTRFEDVPASVRGQLSPAQDTQYRTHFANAASDGGGIDPIEAVRTRESLFDYAAANPREFLNIDPYSYEGQLSAATIGQIANLQRDIRTAKPERQAEITSLLSGVASVRTSLVGEAGINTDTSAGATRALALDQWVLDAATRMETPPDRNQLLGLYRLGLRQVSQADANGDGQRDEAFAFEARQNVAATERMTGDNYTAAVTSLRADPGNRGRTTFTNAEINARHRRLTYRGN